MERWWEALPEDVEAARIHVDKLLSKTLMQAFKMLLATAILGITALLLCLSRPTLLVADKVLVFLVIGWALQGGYVIGLLIIDVRITNLFKKIAKETT